MTYENYKTMTDEVVVERIQNGDSHAMEYLLEKYKDLAKCKARTLYLIGGDNDDLIQEGMIGLYKAILCFDKNKESSFYHFAEICVNRQLYTAIKASQRKKHIPLNSYISLDSVVDEEERPQHTELYIADIDPEQLVINRESTQQFKKEIFKSLSSFERQVIKLYLSGLGYVKIAEKLNKTEKSIDNALQRIKSKIKTHIGGK